MLSIRSLVVLTVSPLAAFVLGAILAAAEGVQINITMSSDVHYALTCAIILLASIVKPLTAAQFLAKVPIEVLYVVQAGLGVLVIVSSHFDVSNLWHTVISVVIIAFAALGIGPAPAPASVVAELS
jgi:hypothetical protein